MIFKKGNKKKFDFPKIREQLEKDEVLVLSFLGLLMEIVPYRRSIIKQVKGDLNLVKNWNENDPKFKIDWIKNNFIDEWERKDIITHIIRAIKLLKKNKVYSELFFNMVEAAKKNGSK